jgi:hypothetical protein
MYANLNLVAEVEDLSQPNLRKSFRKFPSGKYSNSSSVRVLKAMHHEEEEEEGGGSYPIMATTNDPADTPLMTLGSNFCSRSSMTTPK